MRAKRRNPIVRVAAVLAGLAATLVLSGCRPNIPLIPFIQSERVPSGTMAEMAITPPDRCPPDAPVPRRTAPAAARRLP